jgi:hypothetical protein
MGVIAEQSCPAGQQSTSMAEELELLSWRQDVPIGQQNPAEGTLLHCAKPSKPAQTALSRANTAE